MILSEITGTQLTIRCPMEFNSDAVVLIENEIAEKLGGLEGVVFDFAQTNKSDFRILFRFIGLLGKSLKIQGKKLSAINTPRELANEIRVNGLDVTMQIILNGEGARPAPRPKSRRFS